MLLLQIKVHSIRCVCICVCVGPCIISYRHISLIHMVTVHRKAVSCFFYIATSMSVVTAEIACYVVKKVL